MTADSLPLLSAADIRLLAAELDVRPTKTLGQNFVIDPNTIRRIVDRAGLAPDECVVEVGPGLGSLTLGLLDAAAHVVAVEIDPRLAGRLRRTVSERRPGREGDFDLVLSDALHVTELPAEPTALVANLPYNVAVPVLLTMLERFPRLRHGLVMVQDEVADRLAAGPGSRTYGVPSVKAAWYAQVDKAGVIGTNVFWPAPKIHSGLVRFVRREPPTTRASRDEVFTVVDAAFAQRRKTLRAALSGWAGSGAQAEEAIRAAGIDPKRRGETLTIEEFARIAEHGPGTASSPRTVTALAPGKINVGLRVGPRRADGYHGLASVFLAVSLEEKAVLTGFPSRSVELELDPASDSRLSLQDVPLTKANVAWKAVAAVADAVAPGGAPGGAPDEARPEAPARLSILKRVPVAGGMGGGSADAAAALVAANEAAGRPLTPERLRETAARIGADVPFALHGGAAVGLGVGDLLTPVACERPLSWVLVQSERGLSTPQVFARLDELRAGRGEEAAEPAAADPALVEALAAGDPERLAPLLHNDLQEAALDLAPELGEVLAAGREAGALAGIVSGSGPTVALLAAGPEDADGIAARMAERGWDRAVAVAGPAPGARLADAAL